MFISNDSISDLNESPSFDRLARSLGRTFSVRDVMVPLNQIKCVAPEEKETAHIIIKKKRYSVVPITVDRISFNEAFYVKSMDAKEGPNICQKSISLADHIPDSTTIAEAFPLFRHREWYLCVRANCVSGLVTYWAFNSREFCVLLYAALSRVEELSRDALEADGKGIADESGLVFDKPLKKGLLTNFKKTQQKNGGNRFLDALGFNHISQALAHNDAWRQFFNPRLSEVISEQNYQEKYAFVDLRNAVMHGLPPFPDYDLFKKRSTDIENIFKLIGHLEAFREFQRGV